MLSICDFWRAPRRSFDSVLTSLPVKRIQSVGSSLAERFPDRTPPLRERREDIPLLISHFATTCPQRINKSIEIVRPSDMETLVLFARLEMRELQNVIERLAILSTAAFLTCLASVT